MRGGGTAWRTSLSPSASSACSGKASSRILSAAKELAPPELGSARSFAALRTRAGSAGSHDHGHLATFHAGDLLDLGGISHLLAHAVQKGQSQFLVRHLAPAEMHGDLHLVALRQEPVHRAHLDLIVMGVDVRAHLALLDINGLLPFPGFVGTLLLLVLVFAEVHDLADGRLCGRLNFDEVEADFLGALQGVVGCDDANILSGFVDQPHIGDADMIVDARPIATGRGIHWWSGYGSFSFT